MGLRPDRKPATAEASWGLPARLTRPPAGGPSCGEGVGMDASIRDGRSPSAWRMAAAVAAAAAAALASLTGASRADAGAGRAPGPAAVAGTVSTIAGGVGGPAPARRVSVNLCGLGGIREGCGVSFARGHVYFTDLETAGIAFGRDPNGGLVRAVSLRTGRLTTP